VGHLSQKVGDGYHMQRIRMGHRQLGQDLRPLPMHAAPDPMGGLYCPLAIRQFPDRTTIWMSHVKKGTCCAAIFLETYYHPDCWLCRQWHRTTTGSDRHNNASRALFRSSTICRFIEAHRCSNWGTYQTHEARVDELTFTVAWAQHFRQL
jgi:hypothetical protein